MRIIDINIHAPEERALAEALVALTEGGVVAFPTETAYGLAASATDARSIERIYAIKGREKEKALPLIAASIADVERIADIPNELRPLIQRHWPGPLTIVVPLKKKMVGEFGMVAGRGNTIAIRVSSLELARLLAQAAGGIITATSANISGTPSLYNGDQVRSAFAARATQPTLLLNGGTLPQRPASTIIAVENGEIKVLREGAIKI